MNWLSQLRGDLSIARYMHSERLSEVAVEFGAAPTPFLWQQQHSFSVQQIPTGSGSRGDSHFQWPSIVASAGKEAMPLFSGQSSPIQGNEAVLAARFNQVPTTVIVGSPAHQPPALVKNSIGD